MPNDPTPPPTWTQTQTRGQFAAIAQLRWRITVNGLRRKGGAGELIARILLIFIFSLFILLTTFFGGLLAFLAAYSNHLQRLDLILWGTFGLCQLLNIQLGQPGTTFDPTQLIRFPMRPRMFVAIRLFFGLLSPANILGFTISLGIAVGLTIAIPSLWFYAFTALILFAITNALFSRMIFAWVDRWLSTRRAREVFTGLIFAVSLGIQWANVTFNPAYGHHHQHTIPVQRFTAAVGLFHRAQTFIAPLPPGLITTAIVHAHQHQPLTFLEFTFLCSLFALLFLAIFAWRMTIEFHGENLSDVANAVTTKQVRANPSPTIAPTSASPALNLFPPGVSAVLAKEFLQMRRNTGLFYGLIAPLVFVFLFAGRLASNTNAPWIFPAALAYSLMGIAAIGYNSFGLEGSGAQLYFMAPTPIRHVFLAKNLLNFALAAVEIAIVYAIICIVAGAPSLTMLLTGILWATTTLLLSTTLGNLRSITSPKKIDLGRTVAKQASQLSGLIAFGILLGSAGIGMALLLVAQLFHAIWTLVPLFAIITVGAFFVYRAGLNSIDAYASNHREQLFAELCKQ